MHPPDEVTVKNAPDGRRQIMYVAYFRTHTLYARINM